MHKLTVKSDPIGKGLWEEANLHQIPFLLMPDLGNIMACYRADTETKRRFLTRSHTPSYILFHELIHFGQEISGLPLMLPVKMQSVLKKARELVKTSGHINAADYIADHVFPDLTSLIVITKLAEAHAQMHAAGFALRQHQKGNAEPVAHMRQAKEGRLLSQFAEAGSDTQRACNQAFFAFFKYDDIVKFYEEYAYDQYTSCYNMADELGSVLFEAFRSCVRPMCPTQFHDFMNDGSGLVPHEQTIATAKKLKSGKVAFLLQQYDPSIVASKADPVRFAPVLPAERLKIGLNFHPDFFATSIKANDLMPRLN